MRSVRAGGQPHLGFRPLTGVVQQVAQQFQQIIAVAGEPAARWNPGFNGNLPVAVNAAQGCNQVSYLPVEQHPLARCAATGDARPLEFALG